MYIVILDRINGDAKNKEILGLFRERENAQYMIRRLSNLMIEQSGFLKDPTSNKNHITVRNGNLELRYWILWKEVFEEEC